MFNYICSDGQRASGGGGGLLLWLNQASHLVNLT